MKKILILSLLALASCATKTSEVENHKYKYKIEGKVKAKINKGDFFNGYNSQVIISDAIAYTDTIYGISNDSVWYYNTNGSKVTILSPYIIKEIN